MSRHDDSYYDDREIHVQEYDTRYTDIDRSQNAQNAQAPLNYYQRMQQQNARQQNVHAQTTQPYHMDSRSNYGNQYADYDDRFTYDDDEDDYDPGDTYDFGFHSKKKKKSRNDDRYRDAYDDRYDDRRRGGRGSDDYYDDRRGNSRRNSGRNDRRYDDRRYDNRRYDDYDERPRKKRRKRHPFLRFLRNLLIILLILVIIAYLLLHLAFSKLDRVDPVADTTADTITEAAGVTTYSESGVMNILLIGQDARSGEEQTRSDTMIIMSLNRKTGKITLVSLMRDMYVPIAGYYSDKLNAAYALGGMETLDATVQENFGIDIDGNMVVDLEGFLIAITSVGNLDIELTAEEAEYLNANPNLGTSDDENTSDEVWTLTEGVNSMTPSQLLAYSRMRYVGNSDWDRTDRQKNVIQAAFAKVRSNPIKLLSVANSVAPSITTDMTDSALTQAVIYALLCGTDMQTYTIPGDSDYYADTIDGASVLVPDIEACSTRIYNYLYGTTSSDTGNETTE